jgi:hypothetical protein
MFSLTFVQLTNTVHHLSSLYCTTTPLHVSGPFVAHHQEVASVCVANGIYFSSKWSVGGGGWKVPLHPRPPTNHFEEKEIPFATHTLAPS